MNEGDFQAHSKTIQYQGVSVEKAIDLLREFIDNLGNWAKSVEYRVDVLEEQVHDLRNFAYRTSRVFKATECSECGGNEWYHQDFSYEHLEDLWICANQECKNILAIKREIGVGKPTKLYE